MDQELSISEKLEIRLNKDLRILSISNAWANLLRYNELSSVTLQDIFSERNPLNYSNIESFLNIETEVEMISSMGDSLYSIIIVSPDKEGYTISGQDITALREYDLKLNLLQKYSLAGFWERNIGGETTWSDQVFRVFETDSQPITPEFNASLQKLFLGDSHKKLIEHLTRIMTEPGRYDIEVEITTFKNNRKWLRTTGESITHNGKIIRIQGFIQDVTTYRENLLRLFESQETLQFALSANQMGVWQLNLRTGVLHWDQNICKIYGVRPENAPKTVEEFYKLIHPEDLSRLHNDSIEGLNNPDVLVNTWFRIILNGEIRYIASRSGYARSSGDNYYIGVNWDITKEKLAEETIKHQEAKIISSARLSSLGEMAGGIAHEINNPLSVILARTAQLKRRSIKGDISHDELINGLQKIEETCNRIVTIINGLRTISRDGNNDPMEKVELQKCIHETVSLIAEKLRNNNIKLNLDIPQEPIYIMGRVVQLEQVLMNVLHNSYDAISNLPVKEINLKLMIDDHHAEIRVNDSGSGVPDEIVEKVFMPFFTTKEIGKGTGIGLSISKSIIEEHGGEFFFHRDPQDWYFSISLPLIS